MAEAPFVRDSDTSQAAAESLSSEDLNRLQALILAHVADRGGGATCDEVEVGLHLRHQTASARIREMCLKDWLYDTGMRRPTRSRRTARVYQLTSLGLRHVPE